MQAKKKRILKRILIIAGAVILAAAAALLGLSLYARSQLEKIPGMTWQECLQYTAGKDAVITIGRIKNGEASWTVYGEGGKTLPAELHTYEAGSITKTFTAALAQREIQSGRMSLDNTPADFLELPEKHYPDVRSLLTHTSGYSSYYFESAMIGNFFSGRNDFCGIGDSTVLSQVKSVNIGEGAHGFDYSNFGYAVLGLMLENSTKTEFTTLMNGFAAELGLENTHMSDGTGDLGRYWDWTPGDTYLAAGGLTTNIEDMLKYAQLQLSGAEPFAACHERLADISSAPEKYRMMSINMDGIGSAWIFDDKNGIIWHNGGTGNYNSYIGFSPEEQCAVVVLSNTSPSYRIPATVIGVKLLNELCAD